MLSSDSPIDTDNVEQGSASLSPHDSVSVLSGNLWKFLLVAQGTNPFSLHTVSPKLYLRKGKVSESEGEEKNKEQPHKQ